MTTEAALPLLWPTLPGRVQGIVGEDPWVVQCSDCGNTATDSKIWTLVGMWGWKFHTCEGRDCVRRCPDCLVAVVAACPSRRCKW